MSKRKENQKLLIVESPTKAKTLSSYLGVGWVVLATKGHIKDLPPKEFGIDINNNFEPSYQWLSGKKKVVDSIIRAAKSSSQIFIASDPDREGEIIAKHLFDELSFLKKEVFRIRLKEISKQELESQLKLKSNILQTEVDSQIARRLVDRIFGYKLSPVLWKNLKVAALSAGRVQSTVLHWIHLREKEILNFVSETYYQLKLKGQVLGEKIEILHQKAKLDLEEIEKILNRIGYTDRVSEVKLPLESIKEKRIQKKPALPFTTASLQETASKVLGFDSKKTMRIAQSLFEGKPIFGESKGLITYMRTDSTRVSPSKRNRAIEFLSKNHSKLISENVRIQKSKNKIQDAHEAILPVDVFISPDAIQNKLSTDEYKLYKLIWERFLSSLLKPEELKETVYTFSKAGESFIWKHEEVLDFGYKDFPDPKKQKKNPKPNFKIGDEFELESILKEEKETTCPERYTEARLIKKMEEEGIGRPSTYSATIDTLKKRKYILEIKKKIGPTNLGMRVDEFLDLNFSSLIQDEFTKGLEEKLDSISTGKIHKLEVVSEFYNFLNSVLKLNNESNFVRNKSKLVTETNPSKVKKESESNKVSKLFIPPKQENFCPKCKDGVLRSKFTKAGKTLFYCSNYPHCDYITYENKKK